MINVIYRFLLMAELVILHWPQVRIKAPAPAPAMDLLDILTKTITPYRAIAAQPRITHGGKKNHSTFHPIPAKASRFVLNLLQIAVSIVPAGLLMM